MADHVGKDIVLVEFGGPACGSCAKAERELLALARRYRSRGVVFYTIVLADWMLRGQAEVAYRKSLASDPERSRHTLFAQRDFRRDPLALSHFYIRSTAVPYLVLLARDGTVQFMGAGLGDEGVAYLDAAIKELLKGKKLFEPWPGGAPGD